jgi:ZIP family zinc transporter/zinc and cadmium transporter
VPDGSVFLSLTCIGAAAGANVLGGLFVARGAWDTRLLRYFVALGAGFMLAAVLLKLVPESMRLSPSAPVLILGGYLLVHLFEHTVAPHFHFGEETHHEHHHDASVAVSAVIGLAVHSFFDGVTIGSSFLIDPALGLLLFTAILLHKAPEGFAIASVVLAGHGTRAQALGASGVVGAASLGGGLVMMAVPGLVDWALPISAGVTLYVAASDLVPEVNKEGGTAIALTVFAGVVLYHLTELLLGSFGL